jgi:hypothetical protein
MKFVKPSEAPPTINVLLYGPPGTGKSMGAATAPGPILYLNAEGPGAVRLVHQTYGEKIHEVAVTGAKTLEEAFLHLKDGKGDEQTLVVDTVGEVYRVLVEEISNGGRPSLQNFGDVNTKIERWVRTLRDLPINIVLIAHEQVDDEEGQATRRPLTGGRKLPEQVMAQVDVVGYTGVIPANEDSPRRYVAQLVEAKGRRAKSRWVDTLGELRDLDLSEWIETVRSATSSPSSDNADGTNSDNTKSKSKKETVKA